MPGPASETSVFVRSHRDIQRYYVDYDPQRVSAIVELPADVTRRLVDVLGVELPKRIVDITPWLRAIDPIGQGVIHMMEELAEAGELPLECRKQSPGNCPGSVTGVLGSMIINRATDTTEPIVAIFLSCDSAITTTTSSNRASVLPQSVKDLPEGMHMDVGCHRQLAALAEFAGEILTKELEHLEAYQDIGSSDQ